MGSLVLERGMLEVGVGVRYKRTCRVTGLTTGLLRVELAPEEYQLYSEGCGSTSKPIRPQITAPSRSGGNLLVMFADKQSVDSQLWNCNLSHKDWCRHKWRPEGTWWKQCRTHCWPKQEHLWCSYAGWPLTEFAWVIQKQTRSALSTLTCTRSLATIELTKL